MVIGKQKNRGRKIKIENFGNECRTRRSSRISEQRPLWRWLDDKSRYQRFGRTRYTIGCNNLRSVNRLIQSPKIMDGKE